MVLTNWVKADNELIRYIISETDAQTCMLYIIILSHRNTQSNQCYPSISLLAKEMLHYAVYLKRKTEDAAAFAVRHLRFLICAVTTVRRESGEHPDPI